jgi:hypothetical protein
MCVSEPTANAEGSPEESPTIIEPLAIPAILARVTALSATRAIGKVPLVTSVALRAVRLTPEEAGIVAGGVKVDALISSVAPEGTVIVSPESPTARAVPVAGLTLLVFSSLIVIS